MVWEAALAAAIGFQQFAIGMPLADAKAVELPESKWGQRRITCSDDANAPDSLLPTMAERELGIVRCWPTEWIGTSIVRAGLTVLPDIEATVEFRFVSGQLYHIETLYDIEHEAALVDALQAKYGPPTTIAHDEVQNAFGARVPRQTMLWDIQGVEVSILSPSITLRRLTVTYQDDESADAINRAIKADQQARIEL